MSPPLYPDEVNAVVHWTRSNRSVEPKQLPQVTQPEPVLVDCPALISFYFQTIQRGGHIGC